MGVGASGKLSDTGSWATCLRVIARLAAAGALEPALALPGWRGRNGRATRSPRCHSSARLAARLRSLLRLRKNGAVFIGAPLAQTSGQMIQYLLSPRASNPETLSPALRLQLSLEGRQQGEIVR